MFVGVRDYRTRSVSKLKVGIKDSQNSHEKIHLMGYTPLVNAQDVVKW